RSLAWRFRVSALNKNLALAAIVGGARMRSTAGLRAIGMVSAIALLGACASSAPPAAVEAEPDAAVSARDTRPPADRAPAVPDTAAPADVAHEPPPAPDAAAPAPDVAASAGT